MFKSIFSGAGLLAGALLVAATSANAIELDAPLFNTSIPGNLVAETIDQATGTKLTFSVVGGEVLMYDETGNLLANCTGALGLGNFSTAPFDESNLGANTNSGSRVTEAFGSIISISNFDASFDSTNSSNVYFAIDCNNPGVKINYPNNFQVRVAYTSGDALGFQITSTSGQPALYSNGNIDVLNSSNGILWIPLTGSLTGNIQAGNALISGSSRPYLFSFGTLGNSEGTVKQISPSPLDSNTIIFTDGGVYKYHLAGSGITGDFPGYDIIDSTELGFLISNGSDCLVVENAADIAGSTSVGTNCVDSIAVGTQLYVLVDGVLKVYETAPTPEPIPTTAIVFGNCVDADGDGWGWDGTRSCRIPPGIRNSNENSAANCVDTPPLNDDWGWNYAREKSCRIPRSNNGQSNASAIQCIDTDGDGWGWTGTESCRV